MTTTWPADAPHPTTAEYMLLRMVGDEIYPLISNSPVSEDDIAGYYERRHGCPPEWMIAWNRHLWVGPVREGDNGRG